VIALWRTNLVAAIDNWPVDPPDSAVKDIRAEFPLGTVPVANRLQAEYTLSIFFEADQQGSITGLTWQAWNEAGNPIGEVDKDLRILPAFAAGIAPGSVLQLDIVGPGGGNSSRFSSGAGAIIYEVSPALTVVNVLPACTYERGTGETANTVYGQLQPGPGSYFAQAWAITPGEAIVAPGQF
jgi:hypothetical protein